MLEAFDKVDMAGLLLRRPTATEDLVERLTTLNRDPKEVEALQALTGRMIRIFQDKPRSSYAREIAALSTVVSPEGYEDLFMAFSSSITQGTADGSTLDSQLLLHLTRILRSAKPHLGPSGHISVPLGPTLRSLQQRLALAVEEAEPASQYQLIVSLSSVLDVMLDVNTTGLSRESLCEPLLNQLRELSNADELRLAQAAGYAYQALLGIPNDEGPYQALWRHASTVAVAGASVAGALSTLDPAMLIDGLVGLQDVPGLIRSMVDVVKAVDDTYTAVDASVKSAAQKQSKWYISLRLAELWIHTGRLSDLVDFCQETPCTKYKGFLCGLLAALERAWCDGSCDPAMIVDFVESCLLPLAVASSHARVGEWVRILADTMKQPSWKNRVKSRARSGLPGKKPYTASIPCLKIRQESASADLLNKAWLTCPAAQLFYVDAGIRNSYVHDDRRLRFERLSGELLSMDQCCINLQIVNYPDGRPAETELPRFALIWATLIDSGRSAVSTDAPVALPSLFDPIAGSQPRRILIRRDAGVGKSTLCKKIVFEYYHGGLWAAKFNRLLWVPLRTLKRISSLSYTLRHWFRNEYFRGSEDGDVLAKALERAIEQPSTWGKTLFVLDGLDEIANELHSDGNTSAVLRQFLNQPDVIITSRPSGLSLTHIDAVDRALETVGFDRKQVEEYVRLVVRQQPAADQILSFICRNERLRGLIRIPIQLEALCYAWVTPGGIAEDSVNTMTSLYKAIELKLWRKDAARLEKAHASSFVTENTARLMVDSEVMHIVSDDIKLLQGLAFVGLTNNIVEFDLDSLS